mmetsp:Transcript_13471/g.19857  ORF Transcript_13471/g.19857 Transcript_13471/m.19857 type:complete len:204 (+) Transcript_13471:88-699(+)
MAEESKNNDDQEVKKPSRMRLQLLTIFSLCLSAVVAFGCDFYTVTYKEDYEPGTIYAIYDKEWGPFTYGVSFCRYYDVLQGLGRPEFWLESVAGWGGILALALGVASVFAAFCTSCCSPAQAQQLRALVILCLLSCVLEASTLLVLFSPKCGSEYDGNCQVLWNAYVAVTSSVFWFATAIAACKMPPVDPNEVEESENSVSCC